MQLDSLQALYIEGLRDIYSAELQIVKALPKLQKGTKSSEPKDAFTAHLEQSKNDVARLERICEELSISSNGRHCKATEGPRVEGADVLERSAQADLMDAGLISSGQHVEHYESFGYGTLRTHAQLLRHDSQAELLGQALNEEEQAEQFQTELALAVHIDAIAVGDRVVAAR